MKTAILTLLFASALCTAGQIDDTLLAELDTLAVEAEAAVSQMRPEDLHNAAAFMNGGGLIDEASQQLQNNATQVEVEQYEPPQESPPPQAPPMDYM